MATRIEIINGIGYLLTDDFPTFEERQKFSKEQEAEHKKKVQETCKIHGRERIVSDKEFASLENKNWIR